MSEAAEFKTGPIVEVMGHVEYAWFVTAVRKSSIAS
jgi:hypothetical protein